MLEEITFLDAGVFFLLAHGLVLYYEGAVVYLSYLASCTYFAVIVVPWRLARDRITRPFYRQTDFSQQASGFEYVAALSVRRHLENTSPVSVRGFAYFRDVVGKWFFWWRTYRNGWPELGDINVATESNDANGANWVSITSNSRMATYGKHDLAVYYVHGGGYSMASPEFYLEFLTELLVSLIFKGFKNPLVFAVKPVLAPLGAAPAQLSQVSRGYQQMISSSRIDCEYNDSWTGIRKTHVVLAGDSSGAALCAGLLLHIHTPSCCVVGRNLPKPSATVFISPWTNLDRSTEFVEQSSNGKKSWDIISNDILKKWASIYLGSPVRNSKVATTNSQPESGSDKQPVSSKGIQQTKSSTVEKPPYRRYDIASHSFVETSDILEDVYHNPGKLQDPEIWQQALPAYGSVILYGQEEYLKDEILSFYNTISGKRKPRRNKHIKAQQLQVSEEERRSVDVKHPNTDPESRTESEDDSDESSESEESGDEAITDRLVPILIEGKEGELHDWPILKFFTGRTQEEREEGIDTISDVLMKMLLWKTASFFQEESKDGEIEVGSGRAQTTKH